MYSILVKKILSYFCVLKFLNNKKHPPVFMIVSITPQKARKSQQQGRNIEFEQRELEIRL